MSALKTQEDSLNSKGNDGDKKVYFTNRSNIVLQNTTQLQNWLRSVGAIYSQS